jgi:hypothetical protein
MRRLSIIWLLAASLTVACAETPTDAGPPVTTPSPSLVWPQKGIAHWRSFLEWDDETVRDAAEAGLIIFPMDFCLSPDAPPVLDRLRQINPAVRIIGYQMVLAVPELYADTLYLERVLPYALDYYRLVEDHWAFTTTGDTLSIWPGTIFLNPIPGGVPDAGLLDGIVDLLWEHVQAHPGQVDGIMHDYFMYQPYINPSLESVEGEIDLDGNGILVGQDAAERAMFLQWQKDYAAAMRNRFGPDFIQIANGRVPQEDAELAATLNGIFYEMFPNMCWGISDREGLRTLLRNLEPGWLTETQGRTWSIVTNAAVEYNNFFCALTSLLSGCFYADLRDWSVFDGWSIDLHPGVPVSDLIIEGKPDSFMTFRREFTRGEARMTFMNNGGRIYWQFDESDTLVR